MARESKAHAFDTNLDPCYNRTSVHWTGSSLKQSRRGQMRQVRQVRQMRGRFKIANLPQTPKLDRSPLSFERGKCGRCGRFSKTCPPAKVADSSNLIQYNSIKDHAFLDLTIPLAQ